MTIQKPNANFPDKTNLGLRYFTHMTWSEPRENTLFCFLGFGFLFIFSYHGPSSTSSFLKKLTVIQSNSFVWILSKREIIKMIIKTCIFFLQIRYQCKVTTTGAIIFQSLHFLHWNHQKCRLAWKSESFSSLSRLSIYIEGPSLGDELHWYISSLFQLCKKASMESPIRYIKSSSYYS